MFTLIRENMKNLNLDAIWVTDEKSLEFILKSSFAMGERFGGLYLDLTNKPKLILNKLFSVNHPQIEVLSYYDHEDVHQLIQQVTAGKRVGLDKTMRAQFVLPLIEKLRDVDFVIGSDVVDQIRAIKSEDAIEGMKRASQLNDRIMNEVKKFLKPGISELDVKMFIDKQFKNHGTVASFETIVAFGDHGVDPHAVPTNRILKSNESIIIDMGCVVNGYCSDMTRTFFIEENPIEVVYNLVLQANQAAIEAIKPGVTFSELDKVARNIISEGGYGDYFTHRLGHGIGKEVHEPYDVSQSNNQPVLPGMCFSIEPGIYKPGMDAVRIEDLVYVNEAGYGVRLNYFDKENPILKENN